MASNAPSAAAVVICFFMKALHAKGPDTLSRSRPYGSGTGFRVRNRENQHATIVADDEVTRLTSRLPDDNR